MIAPPLTRHPATSWLPVTLAAWLGLVAAAQQHPPDVHAFLERSMNATAAELRTIDAGRAVTRSLDVADERDVMIVGAIAVKVEREELARRLAAMPITPHQDRIGSGIIHNPPLAADFASLVVAQADIKALRGCKPAACTVKLTAAEMARGRAVTEGSSDSKVAAQFLRGRMLDIATAYRQRGNAAMPAYADNGAHAITAVSALTAVLKQSPGLYQFAGPLREWMLGDPSAHLPITHDTLYWVRDDAPGLKPITSIGHWVTYTPPGIAGVSVVATKLIAADHYLEAGAETVFVIDRPTTLGGGSYLVVVHQYRFDEMPHVLSFSFRGRVTKHLRDRAAADLTRWAGASGPIKAEESVP